VDPDVFFDPPAIGLAGPFQIMGGLKVQPGFLCCAEEPGQSERPIGGNGEYFLI
jgi:hypothetical protein